MTWRVPPYDTAVVEIERHVRATYAIHGIVIAGSIVRGEPGPTSDFDVMIVHAEPWRLRDQRRFAGVPAELFVNPPERIRGYFTNEHCTGRPCTADMFATGEVLGDADEVVHDLVREAHAWLSRPIEISESALTQKRYGIVDSLDDARDALASDAAAAALLLADVVRDIVAYAFWSRRLFQPRRKHLTASLAAIDPVATVHLREFATASGSDAMRIAVALARHVLGVDEFFAWTSERD
jgi:hypothetical protein